MEVHEDRILKALRRISRAVDLHSKRLAVRYRLTSPQLVCLRQIIEAGEITPSEVSREVSLSKATVTGIVDRLLLRDLVKRWRNPADRRRVLISATDAGRELAAQAPSPLQDTLARNLARIAEGDREQVASVLESVVRMMEAEELDAAPVFATGPILAGPGDVIDLMDSGEPSTTD